MIKVMGYKSVGSDNWLGAILSAVLEEWNKCACEHMCKNRVQIVISTAKCLFLLKLCTWWDQKDLFVLHVLKMRFLNAQRITPKGSYLHPLLGLFSCCVGTAF